MADSRVRGGDGQIFPMRSRVLALAASLAYQNVGNRKALWNSVPTKLKPFCKR